MGRRRSSGDSSERETLVSLRQVVPSERGGRSGRLDTFRVRRVEAYRETESFCVSLRTRFGIVRDRSYSGPVVRWDEGSGGGVS